MANVIITNLSKMRSGSSNEYDSDIGRITGIQTNEAPVKYLISYLDRNGETADKIIAVTTQEAEDAYANICDVLKEYGNEKGIALSEPVSVPFRGNTVETIRDVIKKISVEDTVYIDTTGSFRNSSYLLMTVVRVLEFSNIKFAKAVYSNYETKKIEDVTDLYRMFDLINAINSFTSFGNSKELQSFFKPDENDLINKTLEVMNQFSDEITLCRTSKLESLLKKLNSCLEELSEAESLKDNNELLFTSLSETIRKKFGLQNNEIDYPDIIKWCLDNRLIQQAVTVYAEKMPEYFYKKGYYKETADMLEELERRQEKSKFDRYYDLFYGLFVQHNGLPDEINILGSIVKSVDTKGLIGKNIGKTSEESIYTALADCRDFSTFIRRFKNASFQKYELDKKENYLKHFFRVKNLLYDEFGDKYQSGRKALESNYPEVYKIISKKGFTLSNKVLDFPKVVFTNNLMTEAVFNVKAEYHDKHLNFIERMNRPEVQKNYTVTDKLKAEELQEIFRDIFYIKNFVRNSLNHASEDEKNMDELKAYFAKYGYETEKELTVEHITQTLYTALERIIL